MQIKKLLCLRQFIFAATFLLSSLEAAFEFQGLGWAAASANITVVGDPHISRLIVNPALLQKQLPLSFGLEYYQPFAGLNLQAGSLIVLHQIGSLPVLGALKYFGDDIYSEFRLSGGTSWSLDPAFRTGIRLEYLNLNIRGFDSQSAFSVSPSIYVKLAKDIHIGSVLEHLMRLQDYINLPQKFLIGISYNTDPVLLMLTMEKEAALAPELCLGMVSAPEHKFQLAVGYRTLSRSFSVGWRFKLEKYGVHYSWVNHPFLPASHAIGLELRFP
ncbi:hypothetical protein HQ531_03610 [bacterium]|nr:hypothetical protein [bacterium]